MRTKILLTILLCLAAVGAALAQTLTARAPQQVQEGQQFRLQYTVNTQDVSGFGIGQIPDAFEVLMGPNTSTQSSYQFINGKASQSSSITYTYILCATKSGTFTIPPAHITAEGNQVNSNSLKIVVSGQAAGSHQGGGGRQTQRQDQVNSSRIPVSEKDLFIRVTASKKRVVEQEPVLLTYKVYTLVDLTQLEGKMPDLKGFHTQELPLPQQKSFQIEQLDGRSYRTVTWSQYVMFPQITGTLEIPSITYNGIVLVRNRNIDPFEAFFNGGSSYSEMKKQIKAPSLSIQVDPLPQRPANFSGGVGHFDVKATIDKHELKANEPVTLQVVVSGTGNLKLIKEPVVNFPKDFDTYDAKVTDKTRLTTNGVEGSMVYEFLAVPRHQGDFDIPAIEFVYYDTASKQYKTARSEAFHLKVAKGEGGPSTVQHFTGKEDVQLIAKDIRHIKLGDSEQKQAGEFFFGSRSYWVALGVLFAIFVSLFLVFRRRAIENADLVKSRGKKANKVATRRLKQAARLMKENKPSAFYDEVLRALWGYVGDKLNIPVEQLSHDNIATRLGERNVDQQTIGDFIGAIDECEFERYAPGDAKGNMNKVYEKAMTAIEHIENVMKKKIKAAPKAVVLLVMLLPLSLQAATKAEADSAYVQGNYHQAVSLYEEVLKKGQSAELYYNLGNAYYRLDEITRAVLNYERALQMAPGDADIRFNLQMAQSKTIDKVVPESEMFFVTWYHAVVSMASVDGWAQLALVSLAVAIILALVYLFSDPVWMRKVGFFGAGAMLVLFLLGNLFAWQQKNARLNRRGAIIMEGTVPVKSTPAKDGTDLFILHEGTKVHITDNTMREWKEIRVPDGKQGWVETRQIEVI